MCYVEIDLLKIAKIVREEFVSNTM